jgi:hypothetical protein
MAQNNQDELQPPPITRTEPVVEGLTAADLVRIRHLQAEKMKDGQGHCEMCGVNNWHVADHLWTPLMCKFTESGIGANLDTLYPMITMVCINCGNTKFLHAKQLGFRRDSLGETDGD